MDDVINCKRCAVIPQLMNKLEETGVDREVIKCITCLNPGTLHTAYRGHVRRNGARAVEGDRYRYVPLQFILMFTY